MSYTSEFNRLHSAATRATTSCEETQPLLNSSPSPSPSPATDPTHTVLEIKNIQSATDKVAHALECNNYLRCVSLIVFIILMIITIIIARHQIFY